jgi:glucosamine kinase
MTPPLSDQKISLTAPIPFPNEDLALGIDAGGTQTRWALAQASGAVLASGSVDGLTALHISTEKGRLLVQNIFTSLAEITQCRGNIVCIAAGITGCGEDISVLRELLATVFDISSENVFISNDISIAYRAVFQPGEGYLVYAGTGSIAAYIDQQGEFHRVGGHGFLLDDGGSGFWIARQALRHIWRTEDEHNGSAKTSVMAQKVFAHIGGSDWASSKEFIYQGTRGDIGKLALAVAAAADADPAAHQLLQEAGRELARLAMALCARFGDKPVALGGRVQELHPVIFNTMRATLPDNITLTPCVNAAHVAAAQLATRLTLARSAPSDQNTLSSHLQT